MFVSILIQWIVLVVFAVIFAFVADIGLAIILAFLGRASEKFENALTFGLLLFFLSGYVAGQAGVPPGFRLNFANPVSPSWFVVIAVLVFAVLFAVEITGKQHRPLRGFAEKLNGWQRLWAATAVALFIPTILVAIMAMGSESEGVLRDLENPTCHSPQARLAAQYHDPCYELALFNNYNAPVQTIEEYRNFIDQKRARVVLISLLVWLTLSSAIYASGVGIAWIRAGFKPAS